MSNSTNQHLSPIEETTTRKGVKWLASGVGRAIVGWATIKLGGYLVGAVVTLFFVIFARDSGLSWYWLIFLAAALLFFCVKTIDGGIAIIQRLGRKATAPSKPQEEQIREEKTAVESALEIDFSPSATEKVLSEKQSLDEALTRRSAEIASLTEQLKASQDQLQSHEELIRTAVDDKAAIKDLVMVCIVRCSTELDEGDPHVNFTFHVLNMSLYPVSVESVQGLIKFSTTLNYARKRIPLRIPRSDGITDNLAERIVFRQTGSFTICQPLTPENARFVGALEGLFWLSDLTITIKGDEFETFGIPSGTVYVQKDRDWSASNPESYFIYRDTARAEAKLQTMEAERDALKRLVEKQPQDALPEDSREK